MAILKKTKAADPTQRHGDLIIETFSVQAGNSTANYQFKADFKDIPIVVATAATSEYPYVTASKGGVDVDSTQSGTDEYVNVIAIGIE